MSTDGSKPTDVGPGGRASGGRVAGESATPSGALGGGAALMVSETPEAGETENRDTRLDRMPVQLDVMVRIRGMRVEDLLRLEKGTVLETVHDHTQDVPMECGGALLVWAEFEVLDQKLAVRITRLA